MKKKIDIKKKIEFSSMIGEICSISLENHLQFDSSHHIEGHFTVLGSYKSTTASQVEEDFHYDIPVDITLTEEVDFEAGTIDITDFYYDIIENNSLVCDIEVEIDAPEILVEERECDGDPIIEKELEIPSMSEENVVEEEEEERKQPEEEESFFKIEEVEETYGTFVVYVVRQNETINSIIEKYHTSIEEIEKYNDIKDLSIGTKLIIPVPNEKNTE
ncbi:MAG: LysM peptidoglycan-binding domain-containing protein [Bacilli bacterium]|nr:LysM peptidoglycan-binding domain-containing protein [Bacilli bacterium]